MAWWNHITKQTFEGQLDSARREAAADSRRKLAEHQKAMATNKVRLAAAKEALYQKAFETMSNPRNVERLRAAILYTVKQEPKIKRFDFTEIIDGMLTEANCFDLLSERYGDDEWIPAVTAYKGVIDALHKAFRWSRVKVVVGQSSKTYVDISESGSGSTEPRNVRMETNGIHILLP